MLLCTSSSHCRSQILSYPLSDIAMAWCLPLRSLCVTNISHLGHSWMGWLPYSSITTVPQTCWCMKCTWSALRLVAPPRNPSTGQTVSRDSFRKYIRFVLDLYGGGGGPSDPPGPPRAGPVCGTPGTPPIGPRHIWGSGLSGRYGPGMFVPAL